MSKRYAVVPEPITCRSDDGTPLQIVSVDKDGNVESKEVDKPWSLYRFLAVLVFSREDWLKPLTKAHMAGRILDLFVDAQPGDVVELTDEQWRALKATLEDADFELPKFYNYQLPTLAYALIDAGEKRPEPEAVEDEASSA